MVTTILLMAGLNCPQTIVVNNTDTWSLDDEAALVQATRRCSELYPEAPCLKVFRKKEPLLFNATCGAERD